MIQVNKNYCPQNHPCPVTHRCPVGAIEQKNYYSVPVIDYNKCTNCGLCLKFCGAFQKN